MAIQITIIGLGQIGASIGLALSDHKELLYRVGHDLELSIARQAEKMGALDRVEPNLPSSVQKADLVVLSLPIDQIKDTMRLISKHLKQGAVVMDTGPLKEVVASWAKELLPEGRHYVGLTPVINPLYLHEASSGLQAARPDLFHNGLMAIITSPRSDPSAIKLAADMTRLLGAAPLFADPAEIDGLMAATHILPQLLATALLNATVDQPGWREGRMMAGRAYAEASGPIVHLGAAQSVMSSVLLNRENVLRVLESAIAVLQGIRSDIHEQNDSSLEERLERAYRGRQKWWQERQVGEWANEPSLTPPAIEKRGILSRLAGISPTSKPRPNPKS